MLRRSRTARPLEACAQCVCRAYDLSPSVGALRDGERGVACLAPTCAARRVEGEDTAFLRRTSLRGDRARRKNSSPHALLGRGGLSVEPFRSHRRAAVDHGLGTRASLAQGGAFHRWHAQRLCERHALYCAFGGIVQRGGLCCRVGHGARHRHGGEQRSFEKRFGRCLGGRGRSHLPVRES